MKVHTHTHTCACARNTHRGIKELLHVTDWNKHISSVCTPFLMAHSDNRHTVKLQTHSKNDEEAADISCSVNGCSAERGVEFYLSLLSRLLPLLMWFLLLHQPLSACLPVWIQHVHIYNSSASSLTPNQIFGCLSGLLPAVSMSHGKKERTREKV